MFVVAGATGRVGSAVARELLAAGEDVRVLVRRREDAEEWQEHGAQSRVMDLTDRSALVETLRDATGFFAMLPFDVSAEDPLDLMDRLTESMSAAVADSGVPHVVALSSGGADRAEGTGPILGLHRLESALRSTPANVTALRPSHFQEKVGDLLGVAEAEGIYPVLAPSADIPMPMVATADIGAFAAQCLVRPPEHSETVDVLGPEVTEAQIAELLGRAMGVELHVTVLPEEDWHSILAATGLPVAVTELLAELHRADARGLLQPRGDRRVQAPTPVSRTIERLLEGR